VIVVDTNIIAYLFMPCEHTANVELLLQRQPVWAAPLLWRSEFRNVLALYLRKGVLTLEQSIAIQSSAEDLMRGQEYEVSSYDVLALAARSGCSAYDCEFVALARRQQARLVSMDRRLVDSFADVACSLGQALAIGGR